MERLPPLREIERALRHRDASYDGVFFTAIRTTGIFCRPSCPARRARPDNREFFPSSRAALKAGYRPCKRCRPLETDGKHPSWAAELLATLENSPSTRLLDTDLRRMGIDPARARRYFRRHFGMTFQSYSRKRRLAEALKHIQSGTALDQVIFGNGYESHSGFREAFQRIFGRSPGRSRQTDCLVATWMPSPLGPLVAAATADAICLLEFGDPQALEHQFASLVKHFGYAIVPGRHPLLDRLQHELAEYFAGALQQFSLPLVYPGSAFQKAAWERLRTIPYGQTLSYEQQARDMGFAGAQRAVGRANGQNRLAILIPCHRVVNKTGQLGGYGGGLWRKQFLLDLERRVRLATGLPGTGSYEAFTSRPQHRVS